MEMQPLDFLLDAGVTEAQEMLRVLVRMVVLVDFLEVAEGVAEEALPLEETAETEDTERLQSSLSSNK
jgi:hypothetical protein